MPLELDEEDDGRGEGAAAGAGVLRTETAEEPEVCAADCAGRYGVLVVCVVVPVPYPDEGGVVPCVVPPFWFGFLDLSYLAMSEYLLGNAWSVLVIAVVDCDKCCGLFPSFDGSVAGVKAE